MEKRSSPMAAFRPAQALVAARPEVRSSSASSLRQPTSRRSSLPTTMAMASIPIPISASIRFVWCRHCVCGRNSQRKCDRRWSPESATNGNEFMDQSQWTRNSTFGSANQPVTTASFSAIGTYVLRLTGNDSQLSAFDEVTVLVEPVNHAPVVRCWYGLKPVTLPNRSSDERLRY